MWESASGSLVGCKAGALHPGMRRGIEWELQRRHDRIAPVVLKAWRYLLEAQNHIKDEPDRSGTT